MCVCVCVCVCVCMCGGEFFSVCIKLCGFLRVFGVTVLN